MARQNRSIHASRPVARVAVGIGFGDVVSQPLAGERRHWIRCRLPSWLPIGSRYIWCFCSACEAADVGVPRFGVNPQLTLTRGSWQKQFAMKSVGSGVFIVDQSRCGQRHPKLNAQPGLERPRGQRETLMSSALDVAPGVAPRTK